MKTIYISGKITGEPLATASCKFGAKEQELKAKGFKVINPLELVSIAYPEEFPKVDWQKAMRVCLSAMMQADEVHLLHDWMYSEGAQIERDLARSLNIKIVYP